MYDCSQKQFILFSGPAVLVVKAKSIKPLKFYGLIIIL